MTILVTGGMGYIGSHTVVEPVNGGYDVVIADDLSNSKPEVKDRLEEITGRTLKFYKADMCDPAATGQVFAENHIDAVIHFAGLKAVGESVKVPLNYYQVNPGSAVNVLQVMRRFGVTDFVFSSIFLQRHRVRRAAQDGHPGGLPVLHRQSLWAHKTVY